MNDNAQKAKLAVGASLLSPIAVVLGIALATAGSGTLEPQTVIAAAAAASLNKQPCSTAGPVKPGDDFGDGQKISSNQIALAQTLYAVSENDAKLPEPAAVIAISAAIERTHLTNYSQQTDTQGLGIFNMTPGGTWGSASELTDPVKTATQFYTRLAQLPGWQTMTAGEAAFQVLHLPSPAPLGLDRWGPIAQRLVSTFDGSATTCSGTGGNGNGAGGSIPLPPGFSLPPDTPAAVRTAVGYALAQLGKPYVWGGVGPNGFDCSGLVMMAYQAAGITIPRGSIAQSGFGTPIYSVNDLRPGDLIFIPGDDGTAEAPGHVGMAIGRGLLVEAPHTGLNVQISPIAGYWASQISAMRRVAQWP